MPRSETPLIEAEEALAAAPAQPQRSPFVRPWRAGHAPSGGLPAPGLDEVTRLVAEGEGLFDRARSAYRDALDTLKTLARIASGMRPDEDRLTDLVFWDRRPARAGKQLSPDDPEFALLWEEWRGIRDRVVRPVLRPTGPRYDRAAAVAYARKYWRRPCDDQFVGRAASAGKDVARVPAGTVFEHEFAPDPRSPDSEHALLPDGARIPWKHLNDCTHFISCCIGERPGEACGGLPITYRQLGAPPKAPYGIVRVHTLVEFLTGRLSGHPRYAEIVAERSEDERLIDALKPGDLIAYFSKDHRRYAHLAMLLEGNKIACHTYCRSALRECTWDQSWRLGGANPRQPASHQWTFLRFIV